MWKGNMWKLPSTNVLSVLLKQSCIEEVRRNPSSGPLK
eukprot:CAMPEP_0173260660 /NCGR_PEP_ID=MMETSP1142-20121109/25712_1 /TAXON_ID=483371 /ORGANISM="non described non described, Strain CCMP2298" /LENGTH=37 /DNA_ID= /DNA_START= /DNA_END= /DNA_ORIENTATION=